jgi:L-threonate 2-dehydrogenase
VAAREMGAAIGARFVSGGADVLTNLRGRSEATILRAKDAGMKPGSFADLAKADFSLSVAPPDQALSIAEALANASSSSGCHPVYADLNAVSPRTASQIATIVQRAGISFTDGSIIGGPPRDGHIGPTIYSSGEDDRVHLLLQSYGFKSRHISSEVGAASALKMSYAGVSKGMTALGAAMMMAAARSGVADDLLDALQNNGTSTLSTLRNSIPDMLPKAYRWAPEMMEIVDFVGAGRPEAELYKSLAAFYLQLAGKNKKAASDIITRLNE